MSLAGLFAGLGDAAGRENDKRDAEARQQRTAFADDLRRVAESQDWPEEARNTAARMRYLLFQPGGKVKAKDYEKMWDEVRRASGRPGQQSAEVAAAASDIPVMQSLRGKIGPGQVPPAQPDSLTMRTNGPSMDLLRPSSEPAVPGTGGFMNMQPPAQTNNLLAPPSLGQMAGNRLTEAAGTVAGAPPVPTVYGPKTAAERNIEAFDAFKAQQGMQLDTYRKQREIDAEMRPDKFIIGADGQLILNQQTGQATPTGVTKPQNQTEMEAAISDYLQAKGLPNNPATRTQARNEIRRANAEAGRRPDDGGLGEKFMLQFGAQEARYTAAERDRTLNNALVIRKQFEKDIAPAKLSLRMARDLDAASQRATRGGDFVMLYDLVKAVDPQSVVREGEVRLLASMMSTWANMEQWARKLSGSSAALPNEARRAAQDAAKLLKQASLGKWNEALEIAESDATMRQVQPGLVGLQEIDPATFVIRPRRYETPALTQPQWPTPGGVSGPPSGGSGNSDAAFLEGLARAVGGKP